MTDDATTDAQERAAIDAPFEALHDPTTPIAPDGRFAQTLREQAAAAHAGSVADAVGGNIRAIVAARARQRLTGAQVFSKIRDRTPVEPAASERHILPVTSVPVDFSAAAVTPYLCVDDGAAALRFYQEAFDARVTLRVEAADGTIGHAEFTIDTARFMLSDEFPDHEVTSPRTLGGTGVTLHLDVADVDGMFDQALRHGGFPIRGPKDQPHGHRTAVVVDPFGHRWMLSTQIDVVDAAEFARRSPGWRVSGGDAESPTEPPY